MQPPGATSAPAPPPGYDDQWHAIWGGGLEPGQLFDAAGATPALAHLLRSGALPVAGRRVLVPGCGRGYDVVAAASAGAAAAVGLDIVPAAIAAAEAHRDAAAPPAVAARVALAVADFFSYQDPGGGFDYGYDYTFLCALHPSMRERWAAAWARHLSPGGELVTMVYPVDPSMDPASGPPWPVTSELYRELLHAEGFECVSLDPVPPERSVPRRAGREWLGRWRREAPAARA